MATATERQLCNCCGGQLPADPDAHDDLLTRPETGDCPGHLAVDETGQVVGCGAWESEAYED